MVAIPDMNKNRRRKSRRSQWVTPHDLCFVANIRKTMEAIRSGLECVETSGKLLRWMDASVVLSESRVDFVHSAVAGSVSDEEASKGDEQ